MADSMRTTRFRFWLWLIVLVGVIVPSRLRADWRQEWEAELRYREMLLARWDNLDWRNKLDLLRRSLAAFWDALLLQPKRLEDEMFQDLRFGVRVLFKQPGFSLVAILTLSLGIGANTAIFSVVKAVLLDQLPYREPDRLVVINEAHVRRSGEFAVSGPTFGDWQARARSFEEIAASGEIPFTLTGVDEPLRLNGRTVTWNFFGVLGVQPRLGRGFTAEDDRYGAPPSVILSDEFWERAFGRDAQALGRTLNLNGR